MQPDVSVLIAAYNAQATIAEAIESALDQHSVSVEVIVVDDASSDRTGELAGCFPADRVRVVRLRNNHGPGGARNRGLEQAMGRWVAILDADDSMDPHRLCRLLHRAEASSADIVIDNLLVMNEEQTHAEQMFAVSYLASRPELKLDDFIRSNALFVSKYNLGYAKPLVRRSFVERYGLRYDEQLRIGEDYLFLASGLARGGRCAVEPTAGYIYRLRAGSTSRVLDLQHVEAMLAADRNFARTHELQPEVHRATVERRRNLEEAAAYLSIVGHLKNRAPVRAMAVALRDPGALRHMRMPAGVRLRRLVAHFTGGE